MSFRNGQGGAGGTGLRFAPPGSVIDVGDTADEGLSNAILRADARWSFPPPTAAPTLDAIAVAGGSGRAARQDAVVSHTAAMHLAGGHADLSASLGMTAYRQTTGSVAAISTADVVVPLVPAMPDLNYSVGATVEDVGSDLEVLDIKARAVGSVTVTVRNTDVGGAHTGTLHLLVRHDSQNPDIPLYVPRLDTGAFTYNADGTVATVVRAGVTYTHTYNPDGTVATVSDGARTQTFTYDAEGRIDTVTVA